MLFRSKAALSLSRAEVDVDDSDLYQSAFDTAPESLQAIIEELKKQLSDEKEKVKFEEDDLLNDALTYYKDSNFDPKKKLRIVFKNQPAADTGGVLRQFFTQLLKEISELFFFGEKSRRPIYNSDIVSSGMMKLVGTIIVHSVLLAGLGFPVFSRSVYRYIATGKTDEVIQNMTVDDCSMPVRNFIEKVSLGCKNCGYVKKDNLVLSPELIMRISHHKEILKLTFRALVYRWSELERIDSLTPTKR